MNGIANQNDYLTNMTIITKSILKCYIIDYYD